MAGNAKPSSTMVEVIATSISGGGAYSTNPLALFDGNYSGGSYAYGCFEWSTSSNGGTGNVTFTASKRFNLWRSPSPNYLSYQTNCLLIYKKNADGTWTNITTQYPQTVTNLASGKWEKTISNLPAGTYKFVGNNANTRIDGEWFLESCYRFLIQDQNILENTLDGKTLVNVNTIPYTKDIFNTYGMNDLSNINSTVIFKIINQKYNVGILR